MCDAASTDGDPLSPGTSFKRYLGATAPSTLLPAAAAAAATGAAADATAEEWESGAVS